MVFGMMRIGWCHDHRSGDYDHLHPGLPGSSGKILLEGMGEMISIRRIGERPRVVRLWPLYHINLSGRHPRIFRAPRGGWR